jgi:hypothetical protein
VEQPAFDLQRHDVEEDRHQEVVDEVQEILLELERPQVDGQLRRPEVVVGGAGGVAPDQGGERSRHQQRGAAGLQPQKPLERANHEPRHRPLGAKPGPAEPMRAPGFGFPIVV